jgi:hypothetical protein
VRWRQSTTERAEIYNVAETAAFSEMERARKIAGVTRWTGELVVLPKDSIPAHLKFPGNATPYCRFACFMA